MKKAATVTPTKSSAETDESLMVAYSGGDLSAFEEFYRRHSARVYSHLKRKLRRAEEADEVLQAVFLRLHRSREKYNPKFPALGWLFVVTRTALLDHFRATQRLLEDAVDPVSFEGMPAETAMGEAVGTDRSYAEIAGSVSSDHRRALEHRYLDEMTYSEIAKRLGQNESTVRQWVSRALRGLRAHSARGMA